MFLCVSLNPAIDKRLRLERLQRGRVNRAMEATPAPGGKAAHVAMVLQTLGADPLWLGFAGGATGTTLIEGLSTMSIRTEAVTTASATRTNLEILENEREVTEILEPGQQVTNSELNRLQNAYESTLRQSAGTTTAILSGSLPPGVPTNYYATLVELGQECGACVFLDTSGEPLRHALEAHPDFVKPNQEEAEWLSGSVIDCTHSADHALQEILRAGAKAGAISLGADGLLLRSANQGKALFAKAPQLAVCSSVGSGDAALAGFAFAQHQRYETAEALCLAAACGAANCLADGPGRARAEDITRLKKEIYIETLNSQGDQEGTEPPAHVE